MDIRTRTLRLFLVFCITSTLGYAVFGYAVPQWLGDVSEETQTTSSFSIDLSYSASSTTKSRTGDTDTQALVRVTDYQFAEQGSFFLQQPNQPGYLLSPLLNTHVEIDVAGMVARATVHQTFTNHTKEWVNGLYVFPLPHDAAVDHLEMVIGSRSIVGEVHPKQKAEALYEEAKKAGKKATLLSQQRPNLFTNSVANIAPGESIQVKIEYQQTVHFEDNEFSLRFPSTITPRYQPNPSLLSPEPADGDHQNQAISVDNSGWGLDTQITQPVFLPEQQQDNTVTIVEEQAANITFVLDLNPGFATQNINSDYHPIETTHIDDGHYRLSLGPAREYQRVNQDIVIRWQAVPQQNPSVAHFTQKTEHGEYGMVMLMPPQTDSEDLALNREVIFILDTSGSMEGMSIVQAKRAIAVAISQLAGSDTFNVIEFNSTAQKMWASPQIATEQNKHIALGFVTSLNANGGTEMPTALELALRQTATQPASENVGSALRQLIFMTDGAVSNEVALFDYIQTHLGKNRLFTVGIGAAPNSYFMAEAARVGKGTFTYIGNANEVTERMQTLFNKLTHPVLADLNVALPDGAEVYPRNLPDLYQGQPLMISYRTDTPLSDSSQPRLTVAGTLKTQHWQKSVSLLNSGSQKGLDVLWARRKIAQLTADKGNYHFKHTLHNEQIANPASIDQQILAVAMQHHLVSSMTSLVAVDTHQSKPDGAKSHDSQVANVTPKGQHWGVLPQTATPAPLYLALGIVFAFLGAMIAWLNGRGCGRSNAKLVKLS